MSIFESKKKEKEKKDPKKELDNAGVGGRGLIKRALKRFNTDAVLRAPRITEKATLQNQYNVYVFEVDKSITKRDIDFAMRSIYNVRPRKIRTAPIPTKEIKRRKGRKGVRSFGKKAYVYLRKDDSISLI